MLQLRKSSSRGHADHGWLKSFHSFSFGDYHDPERMGFGNLRVINEDWIAPGTGFGTHGHRDMEIVTYVVAGELAHKDSMGNGELGAAVSGVIRPGDVQRMSAGRGVMHSEFNHAPHETTHLLQIWIEPHVRGIEPSYEQKHFDSASKQGILRLVASPGGSHGSVKVHADASIYAGLFHADDHAHQPWRQALSPTRLTYVHLVRGTLTVNGQPLLGGDALALKDEPELCIADGVDAEVLVFDLY
jgi:quercetin 2,3-dioxygenase